MIISLSEVTRCFKTLAGEIRALDSLSLEIEENSFCGIIGHSGCGKTTLMNILAGYDYPDSGSYLFDGVEVSRLTGRELTDFHRNEVGMVFQNFNLLSYLTVRENVALPLYYSRETGIGRIVSEYLELTGMKKYQDSFPHQLSGGQKQRVAIARALVTGARVLLADEPTGALDRENAERTVSLFKGLIDQGVTVVMVTHDESLTGYCDRIIRMENGHVAD